MLLFGTIHADAQNAVFDHTGVGYTATPYLRTFPGFPSPTGTGTALQLGFNYTKHAQRLLLYGGGMRNSWHSNGTFRPWMTWQEQMQFLLNTGSTSVAMNFNPGIRYLANRDNWGGYQAIFGLRERETLVQTYDPESGATQIVENPLPKDAVISFGYPHTTPSPLKSRLIFESIATDTTGNTADQQTELATLTHRGNLGFGTEDPQARIEIKGTSGLSSGPGSDFQAIAVKNNSNVGLFTVTTSDYISKIGLGTINPVARIDIRNDANTTAHPKILSVQNILGIENFTIKQDANNNLNIWSNYNPNSPPHNFATYLGGSFCASSPTKQIGGINTEGSFLGLGSQDFLLTFLFGSEMSTVQNSSDFKIYDKNSIYLKCGGNSISLPAVKAPAGSISYLTIDGNGILGNSAAFPNPVKSWGYEGNYFTSPGSIQKFGTTTGSADIVINYVFGDKSVGYLFPVHDNGNTAANFTLKNSFSIGCLNDGVTEPDILGRTTLGLYGNDIFLNRNTPFNNVSWLIQGKSYDKIMRTFGVQQNGIIEQGYLPWTSAFSNTALRYNSMISIGNIVGSQAPDYAIARWKISSGGTSMEPMFAVKYAEPTIILGKSEIKDNSGTLGLNPERLEVKGALIPAVDDAYFLGNTFKRWKEIYCVNTTINSSDKRLKSDIIPIRYGLKEVMKMVPITFQWKDQSSNEKHHGFIAQDLKLIFNNSIVVGDSLVDTLGVRYSELIPILTRAIQEQHAIIEDQQREIEIIKAKIPGDGSFSSGPSHGNMNKEPVLFQNAPNPFSEFTNIDYFIPENTTQASITVTDAAGKLVYSYTINSTGMGRVILKDQSIAQGNYYYSLYANGRLIDTKQLSVVKN